MPNVPEDILTQGATTDEEEPDENPCCPPKNGVQTVALAVTSKGFEPANVKVQAGQPVCLVVTRKTDKTCATEIVVADLGINQPLPLDTPVTVEFPPASRARCATPAPWTTSAGSSPSSSPPRRGPS